MPKKPVKTPQFATHTRGAVALRAWMEEQGVSRKELSLRISAIKGRKYCASALRVILMEPRAPWPATRKAIQEICGIPEEWWTEFVGVPVCIECGQIVHKRLVSKETKFGRPWKKAAQPAQPSVTVSESGVQVEASPEACIALVAEQPEQTVGALSEAS